MQQTSREVKTSWYSFTGKNGNLSFHFQRVRDGVCYDTSQHDDDVQRCAVIPVQEAQIHFSGASMNDQYDMELPLVVIPVYWNK
jgi:hypothetical protein